MDFQGFQNTLPSVIVIVLILALLLISWASYRKFESIPALPRWGLTSLRGLSLVLILLLLLNPYFYSSRDMEVKPKIAVFLDNSESAGITKGDYEGLETYQEVLNELSFESLDEAEIQFYSIGESVKEFHPDSLSAKEIQTNLSAPVSEILEMEEDVKAAILFSDGIITYGRNPSVSAFNSSIPIHTLAIGDTTDVRDISVSGIITNATGYTNTTHLIEADIAQSGFANNSVTVSLLSGEDVLQQQEITFEADDQIVKTEFSLELEEAGLKQFEIRVQPLPDEWTESNNNRIFSVDVLDDRVKILHVAFGIHPDVKAVRSVIERNGSNELTTLTWLGGNRFVEDLPDSEEFNLIVLHGIPDNAQNFDFLSDIDNTPTLLFELNNNSSSKNSIISNLRLIRSNRSGISPITLKPLMNSDEHPILELPEIDLSSLPPLYSPMRSDLSDPQSSALFGLRYNSANADFPVISILERGNIRRGHVIPWGWNRILQSTNQDHREYVTTLFSNLISWVSSDPDDRKLRINPVKQVFSTAEQVILNGNLRNESGEPENDGIIEVQLEGETGSGRTFNMDNLGNGNYRLNLPRLSEGLYQYSATARKGDREIETSDGEFLVSNASSELSNTTRNDDLMRAIAENSGGIFFTYDNITDFWTMLEDQNTLKPQIQTVENYSFPVRSLYWFFVILFLLGSEWMLRKYYSLP